MVMLSLSFTFTSSLLNFINQKRLTSNQKRERIEFSFVYALFTGAYDEIPSLFDYDSANKRRLLSKPLC